MSTDNRAVARRKPTVIDTCSDEFHIKELVETLKDTNANLNRIADSGELITSFARKWIPWLIAAVSVAWPAIGKFMQGVPVPGA